MQELLTGIGFLLVMILLLLSVTVRSIAKAIWHVITILLRF
jgi:hypothetical protein